LGHPRVTHCHSTIATGASITSAADQIETLEAEIESATSEAARAMAMAAMAMGGF